MTWLAQVCLDYNFKNNPAISSEFIKFLATNSGFEKVERLTDQLDLVLKTKLNAAVAEVATAKTQSDNASTKVAKLLRELAVTRRVKTLEDRR